MTDIQSPVPTIEDRLSKFRLPQPSDCEHGPIRPPYWKCLGIYLNDVCLAAHIAIGDQDPGEEWKYAQEDLYRQLRRLTREAMLVDLVRPVACVVSSREGKALSMDDYRRIDGWVQNQDWHRGQFCLYPEPPLELKILGDKTILSANRILLDLMDPEPDLIEAPESRTEVQIIDKLTRELPEHDNLLEHVINLWKDQTNEDGLPSPRPDDWLEDRIQQARQTIR